MRNKDFLFLRSSSVARNSSFTVSGPIVFVTFRKTRSGYSSFYDRSKFKLSFAAVETGRPLYGNFDYFKFTHFHFQNLTGSISYPQLKGDNQYSPEEIVTFTISTFSNHRFYIDAVDLEYDTLCRNDSLTRFYYHSRGTYYQNGPDTSEYR